MSLPERLLQTIRQIDLLPNGSRVVLAVSGGADSMALLYAFTTLVRPLQLGALVVATLDHGLRGEAGAADAAFVCEQATRLGLLAIREARDVPQYAGEHRLGAEEAAREVRYAFLADVARATNSDFVATAHTADDQAETVLMHFLRGSGLSGLKGMLPRAPLPLTADLRARDTTPTLHSPLSTLHSPLALIRPLLFTSRTEIEAYLASLDVEARRDATNEDPSYFRNRLRHELLPLLERYQPNIRQVLARSAEALGTEWALVASEVESAWMRLAISDGAAVRFDRIAFIALPAALQRHLLRRAVTHLRPLVRDVAWEHVTHALAAARTGETGASATLPGELHLFVASGTLVVSETIPLPDWPLLNDSTTSIPVTVPGHTNLPGDWEFVADVVEMPPPSLPGKGTGELGPWQETLDADAAGPVLAIRPRALGDRFRPLGMNGQPVRLSDWMIAQKIPAEARSRLPLLVRADGEILWVAGHRLGHAARVTAATQRLLRVRIGRTGEREA